MKRLVIMAAVLLGAISTMAETKTVSSPDGRLQVTISNNDGKAYYAVTYDGRTVMEPSRLGLEADYGDFTQGLTMTGSQELIIDRTYKMRQTKQSEAHYVANFLDVTFRNAKQHRMEVVFQVSNHDVAYQYRIARPESNNPKCAVVHREASTFNFPEGTTTFLCPQIGPMTGWERTKPSYEEEYKTDQPMTAKSQFGQGYTFPCLFRVGAAAAP